jgi:hypothetical protein
LTTQVQRDPDIFQQLLIKQATCITFI